MPPGIADDDGASSNYEAKGAEPARITSLIRYVALAFIGSCFVFLSNFLSRESAGFEWSNRIGVLMLLILTVTYAIKDLWSFFTGSRYGENWIERWAAVLVSIIVPVVLVLKLWDRVLEALWLK